MTTLPPNATTFTYADRSKWRQPDEGWYDEPDKVQWIDAATGRRCLVVRGPTGALCGYVGVTEGHPWFGVKWHGSDDSPGAVCDVHGGLTYSNYGAKSEAYPERFIHFVGDDTRVWYFGFDCNHLYDSSPMDDYRDGTYRTLGYVIREVERLAKQVEGVAKKKADPLTPFLRAAAEILPETPDDYALVQVGNVWLTAGDFRGLGRVGGGK